MIQHAWKASRRAWSRSAVLPQPDPSRLHRFKRQLRWSVTAAMRQAAAAAWFDWLDQPAMKPYLMAEPRLAFRPLGAYMSLRWNWERRAKVVRDTYAFIHAQGGPLHEAMARPEGAMLLRVPLAKELTAEVWMKPDMQFRKEGEVSVFFTLSGIDLAISSFALAFERNEDGWACYVGAVQGRKGGGEEAIKLATKAMHGLRPKQFMVFLAQEIARSLRVKALYGVGNRIHVFRAGQNKIIRTKREISFDYDELWTEAGGEPAEEGWFLVPSKPRRRGLDEVKPNKRSMYAKRYAMLDGISKQVRTVLTPFPRS
ncbi:MAG TPA: DUF535 family protein [Holophagaceae bacterium]|nr:DUF535 family protein [Holophagaceae bacterium]